MWLIRWEIENFIYLCRLEKNNEKSDNTMKFNVPSKQLYNQVALVGKVISSKNAMTILNNFLFTLEGNRLTVTGSDVENTLSASMEVGDYEGEGRFCADAKKILDLLKELPDQGITFDVNDSNFTIAITSQNGVFNLIGANGNEYPQTVESSDSDAALTFTAPADQLLNGLDNTLFAAGNDEIWPQMMGVFFDIKEDNLTMVATDSRKLVRYVDSTYQPGVTGSFILPSKPAAILKTVFAKAASDITVTFDAKSGTFEAGDCTFNCRFIKGNFPDYNRVIPQNLPVSLTVDRLAFLNAVKRVAVFVEQGHGLVKFNVGTSELTIKAQDNTLCTSGTETLPCTFDGQPMVIGFGATFLIEIFSTLQSDEVVLKLSDPSRPGLFLPSENPEGTDLLMLLMPMTVGEF